VPGAMVYRVTPELSALPKPGSQIAEVKRKKASQHRLGPQDFGQGPTHKQLAQLGRPTDQPRWRARGQPQGVC
jgi:hypothetical protein